MKRLATCGTVGQGFQEGEAAALTATTPALAICIDSELDGRGNANWVVLSVTASSCRGFETVPWRSFLLTISVD